MADPFTLLFVMLQPNSEKERWTAVQAAWRELGDMGGELALDEDDREDTWPVTKRPLGTISTVALSIGIHGAAETFIEAEDTYPLEALSCDVGPTSVLSRFAIHRITTGDEAFDAHVSARANDEAAARVLLGDTLRAALIEAAAPFHFHYASGRARLTWAASATSARELEAAVRTMLAACKRAPPAPYR